MDASTLMTKEAATPEAGWLKKYSAFKDNNLEDSSSRRLNDLAMERFKSVGFPARKDEMYTFVSLKALQSTDFDIPRGNEGEARALEIGDNIVKGCEQSVIVLLDGVYNKALSDIAKVANQIKIYPLASAPKSGNINDYIITAAKSENDCFASLGRAFATDGLVIEISPGAKPLAPLLILNYSMSRASKPVMTTPLVVIKTGASSESEVIIKNVGKGGNHFVNGTYDFLLEEKAKINFVHTQDKAGENAWSFSKTTIVMKKESCFEATLSSHGSTLSRSHVEARLTERGANFTLNSVSALAQRDQSHSYVAVHHLAPECRSQQLFKNVVKDHGRSSVDTTVIAHKGASGTDSTQLIKNLLLTDNGHADTKPNLKIYTDDVQCAHGATTSSLGEEELFYLQTRGLGQSAAKALLIEGFIASALNGVKNRALAKDIKNSLLQTNGGGQCQA